MKGVFSGKSAPSDRILLEANSITLVDILLADLCWRPERSNSKRRRQFLVRVENDRAGFCYRRWSTLIRRRRRRRTVTSRLHRHFLCDCINVCEYKSFFSMIPTTDQFARHRSLRKMLRLASHHCFSRLIDANRMRYIVCCNSHPSHHGIKTMNYEELNEVHSPKALT